MSLIEFVYTILRVLSLFAFCFLFLGMFAFVGYQYDKRKG